MSKIEPRERKLFLLSVALIEYQVSTALASELGAEAFVPGQQNQSQRFYDSRRRMVYYWNDRSGKAKSLPVPRDRNCFHLDP